MPTEDFPERRNRGMILDFDGARKKMAAEESRGNNPVPDILGFLHPKRMFSLTSLLDWKAC